MRWAGHVERMGERRCVYRVLVGKPEGKKLEDGTDRLSRNVGKELQLCAALCPRRAHNSTTVELLLSGLTGKARHPDTQKIRIIGFSFANRLHGSLRWKKKSTNSCFRLHI